MKFYSKTKIRSKSLAFLGSLLIFLFLAHSCGIYKPVDARKISPNVDERVAKNIAEGRGFKLSKLGMGGKGTNFEFSSSNELWRASLDVLDFMPLTNVDYSGGVIITDWYNEGTSSDEAIKITVRFLSNEIRADGLKVIIHKKICNKTQNNCAVSLIQSALEDEIKLAILKKAALLEKVNINAKKKKKFYSDTLIKKKDKAK